MGPSLTRLTPWYPGQMGVPGSDVPYGLRTAGGNVFYLGATLGNVVASDVNDGTDPLNPKATLAAALAECTSGQGDTIVVLPGRYQPTTATTVSVSSVKILGWDWLNGRAAGDTIFDGNGLRDLLYIDGDHVEIAGITFENYDVAGAFDCINVSITQGILGFHLHDCIFRVGLYGVVLGTAAGLTPGDVLIENNVFWLFANTAANAGIHMEEAARCRITGNIFGSQYGTGVYGISCADDTFDRVIIDHNIFHTVAGDTAIFRAGAGVDVSMVANLFVGGGTSITILADGGTHAVENYAANTNGGALVDPTT